ncbi:MAG TPA: pectate lyase [Sphingomonas sp.]|nr:pectate lyase [Sphingomonas sp.]
MRLLAIPVALALAIPATAEVIGQMTPAEPLTDARLATLPAAEREAWRAYLARSAALMATDKAALLAERKGMSAIPPGPPNGPSGGGGMPMDKPADWYAGADARRIADAVVSFQTPAGGWGKNQNRDGPPRLRGQSFVIIENLPPEAAGDIVSLDKGWRYVGTLDNNATVAEIRFLARVQAALPGKDGEPYRAAAAKGLRYLLGAQYPNGGWPQIYPLQGGYHDAVTFNDDAVSRAAQLMLDTGARKGDFAFVPASLASEAAVAATKARDAILRGQVVIDGKRTIWGQQHDALTLAPTGARNFEPKSLASEESADLLMFLMKQPDRSPELMAAVRDGIVWLEAHALSDIGWTPKPGRRLVAMPGAGPLWARFYSLDHQTPIYGDRDRRILSDVNELIPERRDGYNWVGTGPAKAIAAYRKWQAKAP